MKVKCLNTLFAGLVLFTSYLVNAANTDLLLVEQYDNFSSTDVNQLITYANNNTVSSFALWGHIDFSDYANSTGAIPGSNFWPSANGSDLGPYHVLNETFFVRITGEFYTDIADTYFFQTYNDDGVFLYIDGTLVINDPTKHAETRFEGSKYLDIGSHSIELYFFEDSGAGSLEFSIADSSKNFAHFDDPLGPVSLVNPANTTISLTNAVQSSTYGGALASRAIDGYTSGVFDNGSVTHTNSESEAWWQAEFDNLEQVKQIQIYNRTDSCCDARFSNFYVLISKDPFGTRSLSTLLADTNNVTSILTSGQAGSPTTLDFNGAVGKYVRVQLSGSNYLSIAEVVAHRSSSYTGSIIDTLNDSFIDTSAGLEWMDFGINNNQSYNYVISQLGSGGVYEGWRLPTREEVLTLWANAYLGLGPDYENADHYGLGELRVVEDGGINYNRPCYATSFFHNGL